MRVAPLLVTVTLLAASAARADDAPPPLEAAPAASAPPQAPPPAAPAPTSVPALSGLGESCRARSDCAADLACVGEVCVDEGSTAGPSEKGLSGFERFAYEGVHPFVGLLLGGGPTAFHSHSRNRTSVFGNFTFALRGGVTVGRLELAVELSPMTHWMITQGLGPHFQANATVGYLLPLYEHGPVHVSWPLRLGAGVLAGNTTRPLFEARWDVVGLQVAYGHLALDLYLPSARTFVDFDSNFGSTTVTWTLGAGATYFF